MLPVKLGVFTAFARILLNVFRDLYFVWSLPLVLAAIGSLIWGCLGAYKTFLIKKFLAYSSMNQIGFVLAGVACCSAEGARSAFIFLCVYFLSQVLIFQFILNVTKAVPVHIYKPTGTASILTQDIVYLHEFQLAS